MSRASGEVQFKDGTIMYCIYDGTSDIMHDKLFSTHNEAFQDYNKNISYNNGCKCDGEDVLIYTDYGMGTTYTGRACKEHRCILFDFNNWLECSYNDREMSWMYRRYTKEQIDQEKEKHEEVLKNNWMKSGKHFK